MSALVKKKVFHYLIMVTLSAIKIQHDKGLHPCAPSIVGSGTQGNSPSPAMCLHAASRMEISCDISLPCNLQEFMPH